MAVEATAKSLPLVRENRIKEPTAERTLRNLLFRLFLLDRFLRHELATLQIHGDEGVKLPLPKRNAAKARPLGDSLKPYRIRTETIPGALTVEFAEPVPDLLPCHRYRDFLPFVLIDDEPTKPRDQLLVKELRRTALTSTWSRMILNLA